MDTAQSVGAQAGGFSFDSCVRNKLLEKTGLKAPTAQKTGTTIVGVVYKVRSIIIYTPRAPWRRAPGAEADPARPLRRPQDGVVLGADTRATNDTVVADKNCEKIHYIAENIYCCGAGTAADTENTTGARPPLASLLRAPAAPAESGRGSRLARSECAAVLWFRDGGVAAGAS